MDPNLIAATRPSANVLGASQNAELSNMNAIERRVPVTSGLASASVNQAEEQVRAAKAAAAHAEARAADLTDPGKYRAVRKQDGGYDFYDPDGKQVDIATLTQRTNTKPKDWIKDSENPIDIQYLRDSENLQKFMNAILSKDKKTVEKFKAADKNLGKFVNGRGGVQKLIEQFQKTYQRYYVPASWGVKPNKVVVPSAQDGDSYDLGDEGL